MPEIALSGGHVAYELVGDRGDVITLTPGGRFNMETPGIRPLAEALAAGGFRVLLWDRPNTGRSDIQLRGRSESHMRADTLAELVTQLDVAPVFVAGGSGGARDSIITAIEHPEVVRKLVVWSIVGGVYSTLVLAGVYVMEELRTVRMFGIDGILRMPAWRELVEANPRNEEILRSLGARGFEEVLDRWMYAFVPKPGQTIPGVLDWEFRKVAAPTLILRNGAQDMDHPLRTSLEVHSLIAGSRLVDPPWPEDAWERAVESMYRGDGNIFDPWVLASPAIQEFCRS